MQAIALILVFLSSLLSPLTVLGSPPSGGVRVAGWLEVGKTGERVMVQRIPNDPRYGDQWYLERINIAGAWDKTVGNSQTVIAVIDTGINGNHEDLVGRLWINTKEIPDNGRDDDGNGFVDDYRGYNFLANNNDLSDPHGHGTGAASIVAAATNNAIGMAGINWQARLMVLKALNAAGSGDYSTVASAIRYAADNGASLINMSFGTDIDSSILRQAVNYAVAKGVILVAAAGNTRGGVSYPAAYENVIAVGAVDKSNQKPSFANFGSALNVVAPGVDILVADHRGNSNYSLASGTSFSTAQVSGVLSLVLSLKKLSVTEAISLLHSSARSLGDTNLFGQGLLDAAQALNLVLPVKPSAILTLLTPEAKANGWDQVRIRLALGGANAFWKGQEIQVAVSGTNNIVNTRNLLGSVPLAVGLTDVNGQLEFSLSSLEAGRKSVSVYTAGEKIAETSIIFQPTRLDFRAQWINQSDYPTLRVGEEATLSLQLRNVGNVVWLGEGAETRGQVRLGTSNPFDRSSSFFHNSWLSSDRVTYVTPAVVLPGEIGTFSFAIKATREGNFREYFRPVAEHLSWFNDLGIYWGISVQDAVYRAQLVSQGALVSGNQVMAWVDFQNTGTTVWKKQGSGLGEVRLGTADPQDYPSPLFTSNWISDNRPAGLAQDVMPGGVGRFIFGINRAALPAKGTFRLVAEYITWFGEPVILNLT